MTAKTPLVTSLENGAYTIRLSRSETGVSSSFALMIQPGSTDVPTRVEAVAWGGNSAQIRWIDNAKNELGYRVDVADASVKGGWRRVAVAGRNHTAAVVEGLNPATKYTFRVSTVNGNIAAKTYSLVSAAAVVSASTQSSSTRGWYKINSLTYQGKCEAGWEMLQQNLSIREGYDNWILADSWQDLVGQAVRGSATVSGRPNQPHQFWNGGDFTYGTVSEIRSSFVENDLPWPLNPDLKVIVLEDSYGSIDRDYDDFYWSLSVAFLPELKSLIVTDTTDSKNKVDTAEENQELCLLEEDGNASIAITARISPSDEDSKGKVMWKVSGGNADKHSGNFSEDATVVFTPGERYFSVMAGLDFNGNGQLEGAEVLEQVNGVVVKVDFEQDEFSTFINTINDLNLTVTPSASASHIALVMDDITHATFAEGTAEIVLASSTTHVPVYGAGVSGVGSSGQATIKVKLVDPDTIKSQQKELVIVALAGWVENKLEKGLEKLVEEEIPNALANYVVGQVETTLQSIADPAHNDPRRIQADQAIAYFNATGKASLKAATKDYYLRSIGQIESPTLRTEALQQGWDIPDLTGLGDIRGLAYNDDHNATATIQPQFRLQGVDTLLENLPQIAQLMESPGLFVEEVGAVFEVQGAGDSKLSFMLGIKWDEAEPKWSAADPTGSITVDLLDHDGSTVELKAGATYDLGERRFDEYNVSIQWNVPIN